MKANATQLAEMFGVDRRTITNWINADPACPNKKHGRNRVFETAAVIKWFADRAVRQFLADNPGGSSDIEFWRARKIKADAQIAEAELEEQQGRLIPLEDYEKSLGEFCDRLRAVLVVLPSKFLFRIQYAATQADAQAVGEEIRDATLRALRKTADDDFDIENPWPDDEPEAASS